MTEFRAAVIVGSGSLSFEMIRHLVERLPVMICPRWLDTRCQPIAIEDVLDVLTSQTPRSRELRANSPFAGVLSSEERERALLAFQTHRHSRV